jgi:hypothetical protein
MDFIHDINNILTFVPFIVTTFFILYSFFIGKSKEYAPSDKLLHQ